MQKLLASILIFALLPISLRAAPPDQKHINSIKKKVQHCLERSCTAAVLTYDDRELRGSVTEAGADTFILYNVGNRITIPYADVHKFKLPPPDVWNDLKPVVTAATIAVVIFLVVVVIGGTRG